MSKRNTIDTHNNSDSKRVSKRQKIEQTGECVFCVHCQYLIIGKRCLVCLLRKNKWKDASQLIVEEPGYVSRQLAKPCEFDPCGFAFEPFRLVDLVTRTELLRITCDITVSIFFNDRFIPYFNFIIEFLKVYSDSNTLSEEETKLVINGTARMLSRASSYKGSDKKTDDFVDTLHVMCFDIFPKHNMCWVEMLLDNRGAHLLAELVPKLDVEEKLQTILKIHESISKQIAKFNTWKMMSTVTDFYSDRVRKHLCSLFALYGSIDGGQKTEDVLDGDKKILQWSVKNSKVDKSIFKLYNAKSYEDNSVLLEFIKRNQPVEVVNYLISEVNGDVSGVNSKELCLKSVGYPGVQKIIKETESVIQKEMASHFYNTSDVLTKTICEYIF